MRNLAMEEICLVAGKKLTDRMLEVFGSEDRVVKWFYLEHKSLEDQSPYDCCAEGKIKEVEDELWRIEYGVYS